MTPTRSPIRILGLVKMMNSIRRQLAGVVSDQQKQDILHLINSTISQVDTVCRQNKITPDLLPRPSSLAYKFLRSIDTKDIHSIQRHQSPRTEIKVSGAGSVRRSIQSEIFTFTQNLKTPDQIKLLRGSGMEVILQKISGQISRMDRVVKTKGIPVNQLPPSSLQLYQWLKYLEHPGNLKKHIFSLYEILDEFNSFRTQYRPQGRKSPSLSMAVQFYNIPALYQIKYLKDNTELILHEGFIGAPKNVFRAIIKNLYHGKSKINTTAIKKFSNSAVFLKIGRDLSKTIPLDISGAQGRHYNLIHIFDRVNGEYFSGILEQPRLVWNSQITRRKFGHFLPASNTVMISISLDHSSIPPYVIEFVMYHELLHYCLGLRISGSKAYSHTQEFLAAENKFKNFKDAREYLNSFSKKHINYGVSP